MTRLRLALVGAGKWGRNYLHAADDSGEATVAHIIGRDEPIPRGVDAVVVATPPSVSPVRCIEALSMGLPVMVEKPACLSVADALRIKLHAASKRRVVLVNHQHLFAEGFERIKAIGDAEHAAARFTGPVVRDYPATWDYGAHAVACVLALNAQRRRVVVGVSSTKAARVEAHGFVYDGYEPQEPPLTRAVRAFALAVKSGGTDDYRFGAHWAVDVARVLETIETPTES